jgi:hypothetical protein
MQAILAVLAAATFAGLVRSMPWLADRSVPLPVVWPFARELGRVAIEVAVLVGAPIGVAVAVAGFVHRGEARGLLALGQSPWRLALSASLPVGACAALVGFVTLAPRPDAGRFASELIGRGRVACLEPPPEGPRAVQVPAIGASWLCFPGQAPRIVGRPPGLGRGARFSASAVRAGREPGDLELDAIQVIVPRDDEQPGLTLRAGRAIVRGLSPWDLPRGASGIARTSCIAISVVLLTALLARFLVARPEPGRALAALGGAVAGGVLFLALRAADRGAGGPWSYGVLPVVAVLLGALVGIGVPRLGAVARVDAR